MACGIRCIQLTSWNKILFLTYVLCCSLVTPPARNAFPQVGGSLASYFDVYHRLLASRLAATHAMDAQQLRTIAKEIDGGSVDNHTTTTQLVFPTCLVVLMVVLMVVHGAIALPQVGGSLASYFDVYHRLLASRLAAAARATDAKQLRTIAKEIVGGSVDNQHTYVHAQELLTGGRGRLSCFLCSWLWSSSAGVVDAT